ncbi:MAG TPA: tRNA (N(6)-L-threonylcarbamoyladenosine(37)-C(2))-methylthiotransferase [Methanomassiliicoccales archaeon]|nr:tRNA (N(6)-L-threonylcarbamoyladenosine(37)-C(2))-methylthiotransferase [Methanomassiliicoccales archaeon]
MRACVETYGCTMNQGEGLQLKRSLFTLGYELVDACEEADIAVVNTCVVIQATELKILKRLKQLRDAGKGLVVTGCMASVMREEVLRRFPEALVIAPLEYEEFEERLKHRFGTGRGLHFPRPGWGVTAIVPISQGCLGSCSYCITKLARGTLDSYAPEQVVSSVGKAVEQGSKEILLTAQDTGCYGLDIGTDLAGLVEKVVDVPGDFRVRVGMMNPDSLREIQHQLMKAYQHPKVYKFLHLPVQTGSDRLLKSMGRGYTVAEFEAQVTNFREVHPRLTLSTDVITGYPGETEEDHRATVGLIDRARPNILNVTRFSARPGTEAAGMRAQVVSRIAKDRSRELAKLRFQVAAEKNAMRKGEELEALATEAGKPGTTILRDDSYTPIVIHGSVQLGARFRLQVIGSTATHLFAKTLSR